MLDLENVFSLTYHLMRSVLRQHSKQSLCGRVHQILDFSAHKDVKNDIRDVGSTADLVLVFLVHLVHWYLVHWYLMVPDGT